MLSATECENQRRGGLNTNWMTKTSVYGGHIAIVMNLNTLDDSFECVIDENTCMLMVFANEASGLTNLFLHANNHIFSFSFLVCIAAAADTLCTHTHILNLRRPDSWIGTDTIVL